MSGLSAPDLQVYIGGTVQIDDHERRFVIGGEIIEIAPIEEQTNVVYLTTDDDGMPQTSHYSIDTAHFHNGGPTGVFKSELYQVTITFTPP